MALKTALKEKAVKNSNVTKGTSKNQTVRKQGVPLDHSVKHLSDVPVVGMSIGVTLNMQDYNSLRVDCWLSDKVAENESVEQAYSRVNKILSETLEEVVQQYQEN